MVMAVPRKLIGSRMTYSPASTMTKSPSSAASMACWTSGSSAGTRSIAATADPARRIQRQMNAGREGILPREVSLRGVLEVLAWHLMLMPVILLMEAMQ